MPEVEFEQCMVVELRGLTRNRTSHSCQSTCPSPVAVSSSNVVDSLNFWNAIRHATMSVLYLGKPKGHSSCHVFKYILHNLNTRFYVHASLALEIIEMLSDAIN